MADTYKILGQSKPAAATSTDLYTVPSDTEAAVSSIVVTNQSATATSFRISIAVAGAALATTQYLHYDVAIAGNETYIATIGIALAATDKIRVYNTLATLSFNCFGIEIAAAGSDAGWGAWTDVNGGVGFENSWVNFGSTYQDAEYRKHSNGLIELRGLVKSGTVGAFSIWTLPTGYRPLNDIHFPAVSNSVFGFIRILTDGSIELAAGSNVFVALEGMFFDSTGGT